MSLSKTPTIEGFPVWSTDQGDNAVTRYAPIPTASNLRNTLLFGLPLRSSFTNEDIPDEAIESFITSAISEVEHVLDLYITPVTFTEQHDYRRHEFTWNYNYLKLNHPNIISVEQVALSFTNAPTHEFVDFPMELVHVRPQEAVIQLVPAFGTSLSGFLLSAFSGTQFHALRSISINEFPGGIKVKYTAGFQLDKVPAVICELIRHIAAIKTLSMLAPVLFPHNSVSISIDGVSQGTSTMGPRQLTDRVAELEKERERLMEAVKGYYQRGILIDSI